jgi:hypothetical protein
MGRVTLKTAMAIGMTMVAVICSVTAHAAAPPAHWDRIVSPYVRVFGRAAAAPGRAEYSGSQVYGNYRFYWQTAQQKSWIDQMWKLGYITEDFRAASSVIGYKPANPINVKFYSSADGTGGWGGADILINTYYGGDVKWWGQAIAHETTHVLFAQYTKFEYWDWTGSAQSQNYQTMQQYAYTLSESLAMYTGSCAYAYGPKYSKKDLSTQISSYLKYGDRMPTSLLTYDKFYMNYITKADPTAQDTGYYNLSIWKLTAFGHYLNNFSGNSANKVQKLMSLLHGSGTAAGLNSTNFAASQSSFENAFKQAYGTYSNIGLIYWTTGSKYLYSGVGIY